MTTLTAFDPARFRNARVTVMGLGSFGGSLGAIRFFTALGASVTVTDSAPAEKLADSLAQIADLPVRLVLGSHQRTDFTTADLVVASPAVPRDNPFLLDAHAASVPVTSEMNLFFLLCPAPIIAVTGSNGKSTTTALIAHLLHASGHPTHLGGNIGRSLLPELSRIAPTDHVVVEISSFQLEDLRELRLSPHVALVTNVQPNHLDRHGSMENYTAAKQEILRYQSPRDLAVLNADDPVVRGFAHLTPARTLCFSRKSRPDLGAWDAAGVAHFRDAARTFDLPLDRSPLIGGHNVENILAALCVVGALGLDPSAIASALATFQPLPHRLQLVHTLKGVRYVNDSIATNPDSVLCALDAFDAPILLIAGGYDKKLPFDALADAIVAKTPPLRKLLLIGQTARAIADAVASRTRRTDLILLAEDLPRAVSLAHQHARAGDVVLLSPSCASYGQFRNFEERGNLFASLAKAL